MSPTAFSCRKKGNARRARRPRYPPPACALFLSISFLVIHSYARPLLMIRALENLDGARTHTLPPPRGGSTCWLRSRRAKTDTVMFARKTGTIIQILKPILFGRWRDFVRCSFLPGCYIVTTRERKRGVEIPHTTPRANTFCLAEQWPPLACGSKAHRMYERSGKRRSRRAKSPHCSDFTHSVNKVPTLSTPSFVGSSPWDSQFIRRG